MSKRCYRFYGGLIASQERWLDKQNYYKNMRRPWIFLFIMSAILGIARCQIIGGIFAAISLIVLIVFQLELGKLKKQADIKEL